MPAGGMDRLLGGRRVLVTGHTGFKGSWLALHLLRLGARVSGIVLEPPPEGAFVAMGLEDEVTGRRADVRDAEAVHRAVGAVQPEVVFHLAAQPVVAGGYVAPADTFATNVQGTLHVLDACRAIGGVRTVVVATSDKVYGPGVDRPFVESDPLGGDDPYSNSKAATELAVGAWRTANRSGPPVATVRAGNVLGGGDRGAGRLLPAVLDALADDRPVELRCPDGVRPWQHVLDAVDGYLRIATGLLAAPEAMPPSVNIGPSAADHWRVRDVVEHALDSWGAGGWVHRRSRLPETGRLELDSTLAERVLGWRPRLTVGEAVEWTVDWHRAWISGGDVRRLAEAQLDRHRRRGIAATAPGAEPVHVPEEPRAAT